MAISLNVNGKTRSVEADPGTPLLWVLRDELQLTGTKFGCGVAMCGACTVHIDGVPARSCMTFVGSIESSARITTIEALDTPEAGALRQAWTELDVPQCGYCQSGQIMQATRLLADNPKPTDADIDNAMAGNVCRCATYHRIRAGIHRAAEILEA